MTGHNVRALFEAGHAIANVSSSSWIHEADVPRLERAVGVGGPIEDREPADVLVPCGRLGVQDRGVGAESGFLR